MNAMYLPHYEWAALLCAALLLWCAISVRPHFGGWAASLLSVVGVSSIYTWTFTENRYYGLPPYHAQAFQYFAADSLAKLLILIGPMMLWARSQWDFFFTGQLLAALFIFYNGMAVLAGFLSHGCSAANSCGGAGNPSIMVGLMVCLLPVVTKSIFPKWPFLILTALAVFASKSSVAIGLFGLFAGFTLVSAKRYKAALLLALAPFAAGFALLEGAEFLNSSDRFGLWSYMMGLWPSFPNIAFGTGFGSYRVLSIILQNDIPGRSFAPGSYWDTLHNDWLQMLFECGVVAAALMAGTYFSAVRRMMAAKDRAMVISLLLFGIYMGANPALHHAIPSFFGAWLFLYALNRQPKEPQCLS